jgi:hypothetical protein
MRPARVCQIAVALTAVLGSLAFSSSANANSRVRSACAGDYHRFCGQYKPDSPPMRACMQANGTSLSSGCINALVDAGIVDRSRVRRR